MKANKILLAIPPEAEVALAKLDLSRTKAGKQKLPKYVALSAAILRGIADAQFEAEAEKLFSGGKAPNPRTVSPVKKKAAKKTRSQS